MDKATDIRSEADQEIEIDTRLSTTNPPRRAVVLELAERTPNSLCGTWGLYHRTGIDSKTEQALVVAEPQPGIYLIELFDVVSDDPREQRLVKLDDLLKVDDEGGRWAFYDDHDAVRAAFTRVLP